eukprot:TRINITY_DN619_c0_g1_i1.p1 TRINITY_DN619_c0_g1~~TRINITY_DN619_c0_g1_i1.p1  ORF type:complete len:534 (+),score=122.98 TRINITY_DN619_c0_g1_i1:54-1655(+)
MATLGGQVHAALLQKGVAAGRKWVDSCVAALQSGQGSATPDAAVDAVFQTLLRTDLSAANADGCGSFPEPFPQNGRLSGCMLVQVDEAVDVSISLRQGALAVAGGAHPMLASPKRCLRLWLTDGVGGRPALERRRCSALDSVVPGCKLLLKDCQVQRGVLVLTPDCVTMIGGQVRRFVQLDLKMWEKRLLKLDGKPYLTSLDLAAPQDAPPPPQSMRIAGQPPLPSPAPAHSLAPQAPGYDPTPPAKRRRADWGGSEGTPRTEPAFGGGALDARMSDPGSVASAPTTVPGAAGADSAAAGAAAFRPDPGVRPGIPPGPPPPAVAPRTPDSSVTSAPAASPSSCGVDIAAARVAAARLDANLTRPNIALEPFVYLAHVRNLMARGIPLPSTVTVRAVASDVTEVFACTGDAFSLGLQVEDCSGSVSCRMSQALLCEGIGMQPQEYEDLPDERKVDATWRLEQWFLDKLAGVPSVMTLRGLGSEPLELLSVSGYSEADAAALVARGIQCSAALRPHPGVLKMLQMRGHAELLPER